MDTDNGGSYACGGGRDRMENLCTFHSVAQLCCKPKPALKIKAILKIFLKKLNYGSFLSAYLTQF